MNSLESIVRMRTPLQIISLWVCTCVCVCRTTIKDYRRLFCHIICCPCVGFEISVVFIVHSQFTEKDFNWIGFVMEMNYHFFFWCKTTNFQLFFFFCFRGTPNIDLLIAFYWVTKKVTQSENMGNPGVMLHTTNHDW